MPSKICNAPGCDELIPMSERYCSKHVVDHKKETHKSYDASRRNKFHDQFYHSKQWKSIRDLVMFEHGGLCVQCARLDMTVPADVVDHIIPISVDWEQRLKRENLQPLCHNCHNKKTQHDIETYGGQV